MHFNITIMIDSNFITKKIKAKGLKLGDVASMIGVQYQTLNKNLKAGSYDTAKRISEATGIHFFELIEAPKGFMHLYDDKTGEWLGIIPKPTTTYHATPQELASIDRGLQDLKAGRFISEEEAEAEIEALWEE